ncbi:PQQ-binding-like beta-propeller repeat protein [Parasphingorhabdus sp.]
MLTPIEIRILADHLASPRSEDALANAKSHQCAGKLTLSAPPLWNRWGNNVRNTRYQSPDNGGISRTAAPRLKLQWAFGFPGAARARSQPAVTPEAIFTGSQSGLFYALDTESGCVWWTFDAKAEVRSAPTISTDENGIAETLYFGDFEANVYAVEAETGKLLWTRSIKDHPAGTITGSLTLHDGRLFVPMSSTEIVNAYSSEYECCTFRGGVMALDAKTGEPVWRFHTVPEPQKAGKNSEGVNFYAPSGAPVWSSPTIDAERGLLYVGTGENYSSPANDKSDAIIALKLSTGAVEWVRQTISGDAWNGACSRHGSLPNCPAEDGPDFDFGAPPILTKLAGGKDIILAGQKSGMIFGLDPDDGGKIIWQTRAGMGGFNGGVHWGMATDGQTLFVGIADTPGNKFAEGPARQGIHGFNPATGKALWSRLEPDICEDKEHKCRTALSSPPTISAGMIFAGALNGILRVYDSKDGQILWTTDTRREYETINGIDARGGSIDSGGPVVAGGLLIVNSGYDKFGQIPGNVMLVFSADDKGAGQ